MGALGHHPQAVMHRHVWVQCRHKHQAWAQRTLLTCTRDVHVVPQGHTWTHEHTWVLCISKTGVTDRLTQAHVWVPHLHRLPHGITSPSPNMVVLRPLPEPYPSALLLQQLSSGHQHAPSCKLTLPVLASHLTPLQVPLVAPSPPLTCCNLNSGLLISLLDLHPSAPWFLQSSCVCIAPLPKNLQWSPNYCIDFQTRFYADALRPF